MEGIGLNGPRGPFQPGFLSLRLPYRIDAPLVSSVYNLNYILKGQILGMSQYSTNSDTRHANITIYLCVYSLLWNNFSF